jgi:hypothetical protein
MPTSSILLIVLILSLPVGAAKSFLLQSQSRKPAPGVQHTLAWTSPPLSTFKYQPSVAAAIFFHSLAIGLLVSALILCLGRPNVFDILHLDPDPQGRLLAWFIEAGSVALSGYLMGAILAFPFSRLRLPPVHAGLDHEGITIGRIRLRWQSFSYFSIDDSRQLVKFHSSFSPDLPSLILGLPGHIPQTELRSLLQEHLASSAPASPSAWYRSRHSLPVLMLAISIPVIGLSLAAASLPRELALFIIALLTWTLSTAGGWLIGLFGFGRAFSSKFGAPRPPNA